MKKTQRILEGIKIFPVWILSVMVKWVWLLGVLPAAWGLISYYVLQTNIPGSLQRFFIPGWNWRGVLVFSIIGLYFSAFLVHLDTRQKIDYVELDRKLFLEIRNILKSDQVIQFVRQTSFDGAFHTRYLNSLYEFELFCKRPECAFMNRKLETLRTQLLCAIEKFLEAIGQHTFVESNSELNRIPRDPMSEPDYISWLADRTETQEEFEKLIEEKRKELRKTGRELNLLADQVCAAYDEFVRVGRRRLTV